ncbi:MAG: aminotransferase class I/II-fold pyridoxal phosphate-dependent enzyme, partial [Bifidobacteriaceae bacterium]|nr:aminotransferase class I/II-fold pyridoxal phosphate-dependent enzyme [Bifidobacteriaceae bacterium]
MGFDLTALPAFPWDSLEPFKRTASLHPGGMIDLSVGSPVDPTPLALQEALTGASNSPSYPPTIGTPAVRAAVAEHYARVRSVAGLPPQAVLPTIGSKEAVALLPALLGLGPGDYVVHPAVAYPTYDAGARLAGATPLPADSPWDVPEDAAGRVGLVWLNSPSNPTGRVASLDDLGAWVDWARGGAGGAVGTGGGGTGDAGGVGAGGAGDAGGAGGGGARDAGGASGTGGRGTGEASGAGRAGGAAG